jgi:hypothetical protein
MDSEDAIEHEFKAGELESIYAIQRLENLSYNSKDAEAKVEEWETEMEFERLKGV